MLPSGLKAMENAVPETAVVIADRRQRDVLALMTRMKAARLIEVADAPTH